MDTQDLVHDSLFEREKSLIATLEKIRGHLELSPGEWRQNYIGVSAREYKKLIGQETSLSVLSLFRLSEKLNLNPADLENAEIDFEALRQLHRGNKTFVSPRYLVAAHSKKHTVLNALNFIEHHRGVHLRQILSRHFQIQEDFWKSGLLDPINIRFITEMWAFLKRRGFSEQDFRAIGAHSNVTLRNTEIDKRFSSCASIAEIYESMFCDVVTNYDGNCEYQITHISANRCVVECLTKPEIADVLEVKNVGSAQDCHVKAGVLMMLPAYIKSPASSIYETHCVHRGDSSCRYVIDYSGHYIGKSGARLSLIN